MQFLVILSKSGTREAGLVLVLICWGDWLFFFSRSLVLISFRLTRFAMSRSDSSPAEEEFAYHTRLVVYKYLGLIPTRGLCQNESGLADESTGSSSKSIPWELSSLPQVSLIEKLKDSEDYYAKNKSVCDELRRKIKRVSSDSPVSESQRSSNSSSHQESHSCDLPKSLLQEIRLRGALRSDILEENLQQMTVIQKRAKLRVFIDQTNPSKWRDNYEASPSYPRITQFQGDDSTVNYTPTGQSGSNLTSAHKSVGRQVSGTSSSSRKCNTYVDLSEVDEETLKSLKSLPSSAIPLKREISEAIRQLGSDYNSFLSRSMETSPVGASSSSISSSTTATSMDFDAIYQVAERLRVVGDRLNEQNVECTVEDLVTWYYEEEGRFQERFRELVSALLEDVISGWNRVALLLDVGQRLLLRLFEIGSLEVSEIGEMLASSIQQMLGEFILSRGGWSGINEVELSGRPLDLDSSRVMDLMDSVEEDMEKVRNTNSALETFDNRVMSPICPTAGGTTIKNDNAESTSDTGAHSNSQEFLSTPTGEPLSYETGLESMDEGLPEKSVSFHSSLSDEQKAGSKTAEGNSSRKESIQSNRQLPTDSVENTGGGATEDRSDSEGAGSFSFDFVRRWLGSLDANRVFKISLLLGGSVLLWKIWTRRR